jgi:cation diffusion facilitator CzcD-associated flavoprotein CzcO
MLYSFSFAARTGWTRIYPQQPEILDYLKRVVRKHRLQPRIRFNSNVCEARFDAATGMWTLTLADGTQLRSRVVVSAMGPLNKPKLPEIPGRDTFAGPAFHSSRWDHSVALDGKHVVVVGTGASAIQFVPQIAPRAGKLTIFQRTAPWMIPRRDRPISALRRATRAFAPGYAWAVRKAIYWSLELQALAFVKFPKLLQSSERDMQRFIARTIPDPELRAKVTPAYRANAYSSRMTTIPRSRGPTSCWKRRRSRRFARGPSSRPTAAKCRPTSSFMARAFAPPRASRRFASSEPAESSWTRRGATRLRPISERASPAFRICSS